jgi:hypothetical protein
MGLKEALEKVNRRGGNGLSFMKGREKRDFKDLIGSDVVIEDFVVVPSKYNDGAPNAVLTITTDRHHYFRTASAGVIERLSALHEGLKEEGLDWSVLGILFSAVDQDNGQPYYTVKARDLREEMLQEAAI